MLDGLSTIRIIRKLEKEGVFPFRSTVYSVTGNAREGQIEQAFEAGFDEQFTKVCLHSLSFSTCGADKSLL